MKEEASNSTEQIARLAFLSSEHAIIGDMNSPVVYVTATTIGNHIHEIFWYRALVNPPGSKHFYVVPSHVVMFENDIQKDWASRFLIEILKMIPDVTVHLVPCQLIEVKR